MQPGRGQINVQIGRVQAWRQAGRGQAWFPTGRGRACLNPIVNSQPSNQQRRVQVVRWMPTKTKHFISYYPTREQDK